MRVWGRQTKRTVGRRSKSEFIPSGRARPRPYLVDSPPVATRRVRRCLPQLLNVNSYFVIAKYWQSDRLAARLDALRARLLATRIGGGGGGDGAGIGGLGERGTGCSHRFIPSRITILPPSSRPSKWIKPRRIDKWTFHEEEGGGGCTSDTYRKIYIRRKRIVWSIRYMTPLINRCVIVHTARYSVEYQNIMKWYIIPILRE